MLDWIIDNYIEITGAFLGLLFLYFEIKQKIWLWPTGILTSLFYIYIFFASKFYADMSLQVYYVVISIYGWWAWLHGNNGTERKKLPISRLGQRLGIKLAVVTLLIYTGIAWVLVRFTDSPVPYWDAFTTALSITATWMLTRKIIEQWLVWIVVNTVSLGLYIYKDLYATSVLFFAYALLSIVGYLEWRCSLQKRTIDNS